jgi:PAS domain S-box-containing protein
MQQQDRADRRSGHERRGASAFADMLRASDGILDLLPIATFICDSQGQILQYNKHAAAIWGRSPLPGDKHEAFTSNCRYFDLTGEPLPRSILAEVLATGEAVRNRELIVERPDGSRVTVSLNIDPLKNEQGAMMGAVNCFLDITEHKKSENDLRRSRRELREEQQRIAATYEHAAIGISEVSADGRFIRVNESICAITGFSRDELLNNRLFAHTLPDDADPDREAWLIQAAGERDFYSVEKRFVRKDGRVIWISVRSQSVRDPDGNFLYAVRVVQDITDRKVSEQRQKLLLDELNHRVKNTLATVQSLASQSARGVESTAVFRDRFEGRLIALSKAHDQLTHQHWTHAGLRDILSSSLAPYLPGGRERTLMQGEDVTLRPRAALTLAMAFHELTTNAAKYGALSGETGKIELRWEEQKARAARPAHLKIEWIERDGPAVAKPSRRGFGSTLIEGSIASELGGNATLDYAPEGLRCTIEIPVGQLADKEKQAAR